MFSIVVPVWNNRSTLARSVATVLDQTFEAFELILVDDGSTDGAMAALAPLDDPRIVRLAQANAGPGPARNAGIAAARHGWTAFLDADDVWLPDHLAELDRVRRAFPDAGLIGTAFLRGTGDERPPAGEGRIATVDWFDRVGADDVPLHVSSAAIPRSTFDRLGGFNGDPLSQDSEYWARIALDLPVAVSTRATSIYVQATGGILDRNRGRPRVRPLRSAADIGPPVATVLARYADSSPERRAAFDRFVDRYIDWSLRAAVVAADVATVRALRPLYRLGPPPGHRTMLALARLPAPLARAAYRWGPRLSARLKALRLRR